MTFDTAQGPLSELRDRKNGTFHKWDEANPGRQAKDVTSRRKAARKLTRANATRDGKPWTEEEVRAAMANRPQVVIALELGRSIDAVNQARVTYRKLYGLEVPRIKTEEDPYGELSEEAIDRLKNEFGKR